MSKPFIPNDNLTEFVACGDDMHVLKIDAHVWGANGGEVEVDFSATVLGYVPQKRPSLRWRLSEAWRTLRSGQPYSEWVIFEGPDQVKTIRDVAQQALDFYEEKTQMVAGDD